DANRRTPYGAERPDLLRKEEIPARASASRGTPRCSPPGMCRCRGADGVGGVQPRIPRQQAHELQEQGPKRADSDARLSAELAAVVEGARRRAVRSGDDRIDTAHLLHSLLESDG